MKQNTIGLQLPAPWIDDPDRDWACSIRLLLDAIIDQLDEAALVLTLYEKANSEARDDMRLRLLYAKSFVYSLDAMGQLVRVLTLASLPPEARACCERFGSAFGGMRDLRNTLQHIEDRLRGLGRRGEPLPTRLIVLSSFKNGRFGSTTADGAYVELDVSRATLDHACGIIEDLLWSFSWIGPGNQVVRRPNA